MTRPRRLRDSAILLDARDNVATALAEMHAGEYVLDAPDGERTVTLPADIPAGFKLAVAPIGSGQEVRKYGCPIGLATADIQVGECVHVHNIRSLV